MFIPDETSSSEMNPDPTRALRVSLPEPSVREESARSLDVISLESVRECFGRGRRQQAAPEGGVNSVLQNLRLAIADMDATRARLDGGLPKTVAALVEWRHSFSVQLRAFASTSRRRRKR